MTPDGILSAGWRLIRLSAFVLLSGLMAASAATPPATSLLPPSAFKAIVSQRQRSIALFEEGGKVILSPRCANCHPSGNRPTQGDAMLPHQPFVVRGAAGDGTPGLHCRTCHHDTNVDSANVPGNPRWMLAPIEFAWAGHSLGDICRQLKDPARNGGRTLPQIVQHMSEDDLVGWGWQPGRGRTPAPGTQSEFGALIAAWVESGAHCPA